MENNNFKKILEDEIEKISKTKLYYENGGYHTLRVCQIGYEMEPPSTEEEIKKSNDINKAIDNIFNYQTLLSKLKTQLELSKEVVLELENFEM